MGEQNMMARKFSREELWKRERERRGEKGIS